MQRRPTLKRCRWINPLSSIIVLGLLLGVSAALYVPFLSNPLVFDDHNLFSNLSIFNYAESPVSPHVRHFPYFTLAFTEVMAGNIEAHRIVSLSLHAFTACLVFFLTQHMTAAVSAQVATSSLSSLGSKHNLIAVVVALWFALNPAAVYGAGYLIQRTIVFATLFSLLSALYVLQAVRDQRTSSAVFAALFYTAAVFSKQHVIALPIALIPLVVLVRPKRSGIKLFALFGALCLPAAVWIGWMSRYILGAKYEPMAAEVLQQVSLVSDEPSLATWGISALFQLSFVVDYIKAWVIPTTHWMSIDIRIDFDQQLASKVVVLKAAAVVAFAALALRLLRQGGLAALFAAGLLYSMALFLVELTTLRFQEPLVLYRSYLWAPGYALMLASVLAALASKSPPGFLGVSMILLATSAGGAIDRLKSFSSEERVWSDAAEKLSGTPPGAARIFHNRGRALLQAKKYREAVNDFDSTIALYPESYPSYYERGVARLYLNEGERALADFSSALAIKPDYGPAWLGSANYYERRGCVDAAVGHYRKAAALGIVLANLRLTQLQHAKSAAVEGENTSCLNSP